MEEIKKIKYNDTEIEVAIKLENGEKEIEPENIEDTVEINLENFNDPNKK